MEDALVGRDDKFLGVERLRGANQLGSRADDVGKIDDRLRGFWMNENPSRWVGLLERDEFSRLEFIVYDARALPEQHIRASLTLDVVTQMTVWCPNNFLADAV